MNKTILLTGIFLGLLAIVLGAFGAHGLEKLVDADALKTFEIGVRYQMYHALFLLFLGIWGGLDQKHKKVVYLCMVLGVFLFSFSLYVLALKSLIGISVKFLAFLTPIGGLFLILGWFFSGYYILTKKPIK